MRKKGVVIILLLAAILLITSIGLYKYSVLPNLFFKSTRAKSVMNESTDSPSVINVDIFLDGLKVNLNSSLYLMGYRLFIPVNEFVEAIGGKAKEENNKIVISIKDHLATIDVDNSNYRIDNNEFVSKEKVCDFNGVKYMDFLDIGNILGFSCRWDQVSNRINIYREKNHVVASNPAGSKIALIRLEDIGPGGVYRSSVSLEKLRIISDYLYSSGIPFHVAWIPRYISPGENYDYDLLKAKDLYGVEFVYTLDYMEKRGALIGLHGYTHQIGKSQSGIGYEFYDTDTKKVLNNRAYMEQQVNNAIETAKRLKIDYHFYESPHYWSNLIFRKVMEKNFKYLYQSDMLKYGMGQKNITHEKNGALYIPTPLGYMNGGDNENIVIDNLEKIEPEMLASFFFHPFLEFKYIHLNQDGTYTYDENSKLHMTLDAFIQKGYRFARIDELK